MDTLTHALSGALLARATEPASPRPDELPRALRMGVGFLAEAVYHPNATGPGYALPEPEGGEEGGGGEEAPAVSIGTLLASADPVQGADQAKKCGACHDLTEANTNKTGPGLYDVVERVIGSHPGFAYSPAMLEHQAAGDTWTYDNLNHFLTSPKGFVPASATLS